MARYNGYDYERQEQLSLTRIEWRERINNAVAHGCYVRGDVGETFLHRPRREPGSSLILEVYATPSQLGVKPS